MKFKRLQKVDKQVKRKFFVNKKVATWFFVAILIFVQVFYIVQTATMGATLADLEHKHENLSSQKTQLMQELVGSTSLTDLEKDADKLGFVKPGNRIFLTTEDVVAHVR